MTHYVRSYISSFCVLAVSHENHNSFDTNTVMVKPHSETLLRLRPPR